MRNALLVFFWGSLIFNSAYAQSFDWAVSCGGPEGDIAKSIGTDASGNVYIGGYFRGTSDFDPGPGVLNLTSGSGNDDFFIQKLDANGNLIWVKTWGNPSEIDVLDDLSVDPMGNVYTTGYFQGTIDFDPGAGTSNLTSVGNRDIFVSKLDASGNFVWAKNVGGGSSDYGNGITTDASGNVYITGSFISSSMDVDPGPGTTTLNSNGTRDVFVLKLDANGNFVWGTSFGGSSLDQGHDIEVDGNGNVYTTGYYNGTVDFDPGMGSANITANGSSDIFIHKLDPSGNFVWVKSFGGTNADEGNAIAVDPSGNIYSTGIYRGTVDFDPNAGTNTITSAGSDDIFIQKLDPQGNFQWAHSFGNFSSDIGSDITVDQAGNVYTIGAFRHTVDFDPGSGTANGVSNSGDDIFIQKLDENGGFVWVQIFGSDANDEPNSINIGPNSTVLSCGRFPGTGDFDPTAGTETLTTSGSNDIFVQKLNQCTPSSGTDVVSACDTYDWIDGNTYTSSNSTATHTLTNVSGCDSIVTLNLTMSYSNTGNDVQTACGAFTWIDGNTYTSSTNTPTYTLTNQSGCDSVVSLDLTINNVDVSTTNNSPVLTANASSASYQWIDCDNSNTLISGETNQTFTASSNGNYAVIVTENGCTDTSNCLLVNTIGIEGVNYDEVIVVYPNPTEDLVHIRWENNANKIIYKVVALDGKTVVKEKTINSNNFTVDLSKETSGVYFIKIKSSNRSEVVKVIKR